MAKKQQEANKVDETSTESSLYYFEPQGDLTNREITHLLEKAFKNWTMLPETYNDLDEGLKKHFKTR